MERKLNAAFASNFKTRIDHRTLLDTLRHANMWKMSALEIVRKRIAGEEAYFHHEAELVEIDDEIYVVMCGEDSRQTLSFIDHVEETAASVYRELRGREGSTGLSPLGFDGSVLDYLMYALVERPIRRYLYYGLQNDEYGLFAQLERFLGDARGELTNEAALLDLSMYCGDNGTQELFGKTGKWLDDPLYAAIRSGTEGCGGGTASEG